jgi:hypothetical protein
MRLALLCLLLQGCALGIPDADPPVPKVKPCQVIVIVEPDHKATCMTRREFENAMKGVLN